MLYLLLWEQWQPRPWRQTRLAGNPKAHLLPAEQAWWGVEAGVVGEAEHGKNIETALLALESECLASTPRTASRSYYVYMLSGTQ